MKTTPLCGLLSACLLAALPAQGAIIQYTDVTAFNFAAGVTTLETFDAFLDGNLAPSTDLGAFTVSTNSTASITTLPFGNDVNGTRYLQADIFAGIGPGTITFTFDAPIMAFGANFASLNNGSPRTFATVGGTDFNPLPNAPSFLGFVSSTGFTTVTFTNPFGGGDNDSFGVDNLRFGGVVPEPATWAMMIIGFGAAGSVIRRRRAVVA
jgi:hypothetical protein